MAFMMPVVKNDWDIYKSQRSRRNTESGEKPAIGGRVRKVSESRSEGPMSPMGRGAALSPHRSAPTMRSLSYCGRPPARSARPASPPEPAPAQAQDKFHTRLVDKLRRALSRSDSRADERSS